VKVTQQFNGSTEKINMMTTVYQTFLPLLIIISVIIIILLLLLNTYYFDQNLFILLTAHQKKGNLYAAQQ
jgi:hypothetical protein